MLRKELYRIMIKEKFLIVLLFFVLFKLLISFGTEYAYAWKSESETDFYRQYLKEISGRGEEGKYEKIEKDYKDERIMAQHYSAMETIYADYQYVLEDTKKHYFLKDDGFELFFLHSDRDWLCLFLITFLSIQIVSKDYICRVIQVAHTSIFGRNRLAIVRAGLMIGLTAILSLLSTGIPLLCYGIRHGLSSGNAPLQSISLFATSQKNLTILQAWFCIVLLRMAAYVIFGMIIFGVASVCRNPAFCMFIGLGIVFFPLYLLSTTYHQEKIYQTIIPIGALDGVGFLLGDSKPVQENNFFFQELRPAEIIGIFVLQFILGMLLMMVAVIRISGKQIELKKRIWNIGKFSALIVVCSIFCCSCAGQEGFPAQTEKISGRDLVTCQYVKIDEYHFYDMKDKKIYEIGETILDNERILAIGDSHILTARKEINGNLSNEFSIELLDYKKNKRQTLIRFGRNVDETALLGLDDMINIEFLSSSGQEIQNMGINESVVYENGCIYYAYNNVVVQADCRKKEYRIIYQTAEMKNTIISEGEIYYINGLGELIRYDRKTEETTVLCENIRQVWIDADKIFVSKEEESGLFLADRKRARSDGEIPLRKISNKTPEVLDIEDNKVVFESEGKIYLCRLEAETVVEKELETEVSGSLAGINNGKVYIIQYEEGGVKVVVCSI